jgi:hypothetical protein
MKSTTREAKRSRSALSSKTVQKTCCLLLPVGAKRATSRRSARVSRGTGFFRKVRTDRRARRRCLTASRSGRRSGPEEGRIRGAGRPGKRPHGGTRRHSGHRRTERLRTFRRHGRGVPIGQAITREGHSLTQMPSLLHLRDRWKTGHNTFLSSEISLFNPLPYRGGRRPCQEGKRFFSGRA